jgi:hypothetical protein
MSCGSFRIVANNTSFARHACEYGTELLHAAANFRSRVLAEGWECVLPFRRRFTPGPHATMLCVLLAVCPACPVATTLYVLWVPLDLARALSRRER